MASLEKLVTQLRKKKQDATKLRIKAEAELKKYRSAEKRSASGIISIDKKIDSEKENVFDVSTILNQKTSQLESIGRLVASAEERLTREKESVDNIQQEIEFAENPEEKQNAEARLHSLIDHIEEITAEIKNRQKTAKKISEEIANFSNIKSKITSTIQKQSKSKPTLRETMVTSRKSAGKLVKELEKRIKAEEYAKTALDKASSKLKEFLTKKRKSTNKKPSKKTAAKRKPSKKTAAKRKPSKKTAAKRKPSKKKSRR